ncbi:MAG: hypothetical protein ISQ34_00455 [Rickettsiales bacterium]|nr:hypothetical protein [Rickettsiales bacterium]
MLATYFKLFLILFSLFVGHNGFEITAFDSRGFALEYVGDREFDDEELDNVILSAML